MTMPVTMDVTIMLGNPRFEAPSSPFETWKSMQHLTPAGTYCEVG